MQLQPARVLPCRAAILLCLAGCSSSVGVAADGTPAADGTVASTDASLDADARTSPGTDDPDGAPPTDAGTCVDFGAPVFDTTCASDADCVSVYGGTLCPGYNCVCAAGRSINAREIPRYQTLAASVPRGAGPFCSCPALGRSRCAAGQCVWCSNFASDGGNPVGCGG